MNNRICRMEYGCNRAEDADFRHAQYRGSNNWFLDRAQRLGLDQVDGYAQNCGLLVCVASPLRFDIVFDLFAHLQDHHPKG